MSYKADINRLEIKKSILVNTIGLFIPDENFILFTEKLKKINYELYKFRSLRYLSNFTNEGIWNLYIKCRNDVNHLGDVCDSLNIKDIEIFRYELYKAYRDYIEQRQ